MAWLTVISLLTLVCETFADYCGENISCQVPYKCCETKTGCCFDINMQLNNKHIRPQIWNMWYFWFLVVFIMVSCFGGCGYYRHRRLASITRNSNQRPTRIVTILGPVERRSSRSSEGSFRQFDFFAYNGPGINIPQPTSNLPPPYAEVISHPRLYPINKAELPPYQEDCRPLLVPPGTHVLPHPETSLPPPYCEFPCEPPQPSLSRLQNDVYSHYWEEEQPPATSFRDADNSRMNNSNENN